MKKPVVKTILSLSMVLTVFSLSFGSPMMALAGPGDYTAINGFNNQPLNYDNPNAGNENNPFRISLRSVVNSGLLTQVIGCTGLVNKLAGAITKLEKKIVNSIFKLASGDTPVQTQDQKAQEKLDAAAFREECITGIAVQLAKNQLAAMTKYTMNWVNTGFKGDPLFVRDVDSFMQTIEDNILQKELELFKGISTEYPYGRDFAQGAISSQQSAKNFAESMKQDLTSYLLPGATPDSFSKNFADGGWDAWFALSLDNNNPLGFTYRNSQNIADEQSDAVTQKTDEINRNGGTVDQRKCLEFEKPKSTPTQQQLTNGTSPAGAFTFTMVNGQLVRTPVATAPAAPTVPKCIRYETVTPGSLIKDKISAYINSPERQIELVKTMNDALNSLFSSLVNKFENQGLAGLRSARSNFVGTQTGGTGTNQVFDTLGNSLTVGGITLGSGISDPGTGDGFFDLTRDLGNKYVNGQVVKKGVIQLQFDYITKLKESMAVIDDILPSLGALDYCIPGPNTNWRANSQDDMITYISSLGSGMIPIIDPNTLDATLDDYGNAVDAVYGEASPMQDGTIGNTSYLAMAGDGLAITKNITLYAESIEATKDDYQNLLLESNANMSKLKTIKDKVNAIMTAAQNRRNAKRTQGGLPAIQASCLATERVTYLDNGVIK